MESAPAPKHTPAPVAVMEAPKAAPPVAISQPAAQTSAPSPAPAAARLTPFAATPIASAPAFSAPMTEGALAKAPEVVSAPQVEGDPEAFRRAVVAALAQAGHNSASQALESALWALEGGGLRIEIGGMGKKMIALTVNAQAEKIIRQELQKLNGPARFMVVPGEGGVRAGGVSAVPLAGSVEETALADPLVQKAKEIFKAEVRSVVDLRVK